MSDMWIEDNWRNADFDAWDEMFPRFGIDGLSDQKTSRLSVHIPTLKAINDLQAKGWIAPGNGLHRLAGGCVFQLEVRRLRNPDTAIHDKGEEVLDAFMSAKDDYDLTVKRVGPVLWLMHNSLAD